MKIDPGTYRDLEQARDQIFRDHQWDRNFTGCGIGISFRAGKRTEEPAVLAMVVNKLPASAVSRRRLLPRTVRVGDIDYRVDVVETGTPRPSAHTAQSAADTPATGGPLTGYIDPPAQGCSISIAGGPTGTLGCIALDNELANISILSTSHVIANLGQAPVGTPVIQPSQTDASLDGIPPVTIAALTRYAEFTSDSTNTVDAAIAALSDQSNYTLNVVLDLMAPISLDHPAVGMLVATDDSSSNCFLCRMDNVLSALNAGLPTTSYELIQPVVPPEVGVNIEKVGRTSGYTSSTIDAIGVIVQVTYSTSPDSSEMVVFYDQIWTQAFGLSGDSGAVACVGGNGTTYAPASTSGGCPLLSAIEDYYALADGSASVVNDFTNQVQDRFLAQTRAGNYLIELVYLNTQVAINRLQSDQGTSYNQASAQTFMQQYYTKYYDMITSYTNAPNPDTVISSGSMRDMATALVEIGGPTSEGFESLLSYGQNLDINSASYAPSRSGLPELGAAVVLAFYLDTNVVESSSSGTVSWTTIEKVATFMNQESTYSEFQKIFGYVRTIEQPDGDATLD